MSLPINYLTRAMAALSLPFAANISSSAEDTTIGLAVANLQADFFNQIKQSVDAEAKVKGVKLIVADAKGDAATQVDQIQDLITRGVKAIIYIPAGATAAGVPVKAAKKANIPVINVDRNAPDAPGDTFIATDSVGAARTLGEYVCKVTGGKATLAILQGQLGTTPELDRDKGFNEALANCPASKWWLSNGARHWMQDEALRLPRTCYSASRILMLLAARTPWRWARRMRSRWPTWVTKYWIFGFDGDVAGLKRFAMERWMRP